MALRWRRQPDEQGLAMVVQGPRGYELSDGGVVVMRVAPTDRASSGWYWYGFGRNTFSDPVATADDAKKQAADHYREHKTESHGGRS